jgi:hypothetical protein
MSVDIAKRSLSVLLTDAVIHGLPDPTPLVAGVDKLQVRRLVGRLHAGHDVHHALDGLGSRVRTARPAIKDVVELSDDLLITVSGGSNPDVIRDLVSVGHTDTRRRGTTKALRIHETPRVEGPKTTIQRGGGRYKRQYRGYKKTRSPVTSDLLNWETDADSAEGQNPGYRVLSHINGIISGFKPGRNRWFDPHCCKRGLGVVTRIARNMLQGGVKL